MSKHSYCPAYPTPVTSTDAGDLLTSYDYDWQYGGFTKLEKAALMLAAGTLADSSARLSADELSRGSVALAKMILDECAKESEE